MKAADPADEGVSPIIGVMLMIVVTIIIAAIVSAFAGGFSGSEKKAPVSVFSSTILHNPLGSGTGSNPYGGLLFTLKSGDDIFLNSTYLVLTNGDQTRRFGATSLIPISNFVLKTGGQFMVAADTDGSTTTDGYMGWTNPDFVLTTTEIQTFTLVDSETGQTIAQGRISV